jgi:uncharacterized protein
MLYEHGLFELSHCSINYKSRQNTNFIKMIIDRDVSIPTGSDTLRADVFRPDDSDSAKYPVIMTYGPYAKGAPYSVAFKPQWEWLISTYPDILPGSTREFMNWETVDPEIWTKWGYVVIRVDSLGAGRSQGKLDIFSPAEVQGYYDAIEWAAAQPWSTGKVGLNGISYYAINQWLVATLQPPSLTCMIPWEGAGDFYRDMGRHGGIESNNFINVWYHRQVVSMQHGNKKTINDPWLNEPASGPVSELVSDDELKANRTDPIQDILERPLDSEWYRQRSPDWSKVKVPFLSAASWAGHGLHARGNFEAFTQAASKQKWLECHPGRHEEWFYLDRGMELQKRFLDHFLKGADNGWDKEPPVIMNLRRPFSEEWEVRKETSWPLPNTKWTKLYLDADLSMSWSAPSKESSTTFSAMEDVLTFRTPPIAQDVEITGPLALKLFASSSTTDMDLFAILQAFSPDGKEVDFQGTVDPHSPLAQGWLRASHRKLDTKKSLPYRPYHSHDEIQPLQPGKVYELDIEIWPTNVLLPAGYTIALQIRGTDFERELPPDVPNEAWTSRGSGPWLHNHPEDRPGDVFGGVTRVFTGGERESYLLLPIIES